MLWQYARGAFPGFLDEDFSRPPGWVKTSHRGIQRLDRIQIPSSQRRYVFAPRFEICFDRAFGRVLEQCGALDRSGYTWLTAELMQGFRELHAMGFAHSYEAWEKGQLVAGAFGVQIGGFIGVSSMFHRADHAGKAAYVRTLLHLRERGFECMDVGAVSPHFERWGAEWLPQWQFEQTLPRLLNQRLALTDGSPPPRPPAWLRAALSGVRAADSAVRRLGRVFRPRPATPPIASAAATPAQRANRNERIPPH